ncbi:helix-turn-helix domain-containing protein [Streptomyces sp. 8N706]|uniref:helix-turn-helix domain-containing protein n=1 Tax=Streptomyces sp. 8N706 TaxID=3457416 RepID=UPI003FD22A1A
MSVSAEHLPDSVDSADSVHAVGSVGSIGSAGPAASRPAQEPTPSPPAEVLTAGCYDEGPGYAVHRPRGAESWLFTWTVAGQGSLRQGGAEVDAREGDLVALGPEVPHHYGVAPGADRWAFWWVHCQARPSWQTWLRPYGVGGGLHAVSPVPPAVRPRVDAAVRRVLADARWSGDGAPPEPPAMPPSAVPSRFRAVVAQGVTARELALGAVEEMLLLATAAAGAARTAAGAVPVAAGADRTHAAGEVDPRVRRLEALIAADPAAAHTVGSLAAHVGLSPSRLAHLFSAQRGRTPMRMVRDARLRHAARLLEVTDLPVDRVAAASGFASPYHFSRVFRARFGAPPGAYRNGFRRGRGH